MKIYLHEISDQEKEISLQSTQKTPEPWLEKLIASLDEETFTPQDKSRTISAQFKLRKVDQIVIVKGEVDTQIQLLCSRCATPFLASMHPQFQMLYSKDPEMAGVVSDRSGSYRQETGHARHAHDFDNDPSLDADVAFLQEEFIDLSDVTREQLELLIPFQPLCREGCKGICGNCGADLNRGRCACDKLSRMSPFAAIKDIKSKASNQ